MNKKRFIVVIIGITAAVLAMFIILSLSLSDKNINGITGTVGIFKLFFTNESGVKLTDEPMQYIIKNGNGIKNENLESFLDKFAEKYNVDSYYDGSAVINGLEYSYKCRSFTNMYLIVTFQPL